MPHATPFRRAVLAFAAALAAAAGALVAGPSGRAAAAGDPNPIRSVGVAAPDVPAGALKVGATVELTATAQFVPNEGGSPWVVFQWDFGDGGPVVDSGQVHGSGAGPIEHTATNVFLQPGQYTVRCTANHGFALFGYRFSRTKTVKLTIACADSAPSPKRCGRGVYEAFTGLWQITFPGRDDVNAKVLLDESLGVVFGVMDLNDDPLSEFPSKFNVRGLVGTGRVRDGDAMVPCVKVKLRAIRKFGKAGDEKTTLELTLPIRPASATTYRVGQAALRRYYTSGDLEGRLDRLAPPTSADQHATVCTILSAGRAKTAPGALLAFAASLQNEGPASLPGQRLRMTVELEGATVVAGTVKGQRVVTTATGDRTIVFGLPSLGKGSAADGRASAGFVVLVDEDATEVECRLRVEDPDPQGDLAHARVQLPPDRVLCIPVEAR